ncbi:MAG: 7-cyano-7-deazaguanine synthase [Thermoplasmataceae archaeon]
MKLSKIDGVSQERSKKKNCMVLISGGIDSSACIYYYQKLGYTVNGIFIDYGQISAIFERQSARRIAENYQISLLECSYVNDKTYLEGEIPGRNAFLLTSAVLSNPGYRGILAIGIHSGTSYYDCSRSFLDDIRRIITNYTNGNVIVDAPFLQWTKVEIYHFCKENNVPISLTYSCENGTDPPCGHCNSCLDRRLLSVS